MSVFNDFQRVWMQRFPQSSLSDAWEEDVRASLERHKQKISELTKELEQETLYVEYLERLLSDVEKYKESGGDPTTLFEAATNSNSTAAHATPPADNNELAENKSSLNLLESRKSSSSSGNNEGNDKTKRLSFNSDNKYANSNNNNNNNNNNINNDNGNKSSNSNNNNKHTNAGGTAAVEQPQDKDAGTEKDLRIQKNGALNQCITELAATFSEAAAKDGEPRKQLKPVKGGAASSSHFVTVIELKENKNEQETENASDNAENSSQNKFSSFERKSTEVEPTAPPMSPAITTSSMSASAYAAHLEAKKKVPPR